MLDIHLFRDEPDSVKRALARRGEDSSVVDSVRELDERRRAVLTEVEALRAARNTGSKAIGKATDKAEREAKIARMRKVNESIATLESDLSEVERRLSVLVAEVANIPADDVPDGADERDNVVLRQVGQRPRFDFEVKPHWEIGAELDLIDFERGVRMSGSRFYVLKGAGARLQRSLIQFMLDFHTSRGYTEVYPPFMVSEQQLWNAGQLPKFRDNLYRDAEEDYWFVPTAEVPLTAMHAGEILGNDDLPRNYVAYTACFRREKMSAGRDVRGIKRGHQFDKVEMYKFTRPEDSAQALQAMLADGEAVLEALGLPYRVVELCAGDLGFGSTKTFDLEVWAPGCGEWLEVSSISDFGSFQARRAGVRFRREPSAATEHVHTLNGSGLGLPRVLIAVLENYQAADGSIAVPEILRERMGMDAIAEG